MYACLDLGSNSFHLLIADCTDDRITIIERLSAKVQLGEGLAVDGRISDAAFERGLHCLEWFREHLQRLPVSRLWAVGTNALRQADNAGSFLQQARKFGFDIDVISGEQEAALVYAGVTADLPDNDVNRLVIDIGGGSTELIVGQRDTALCVVSLAVGCVSWRDRYMGASHNVSESEAGLDKALGDAEAAFETVCPQLSRLGWEQVHASSGTARMLAAVCAGTGDPPGEIRRSTLCTLRSKALDVASDNRRSLPGLKPARRDVLLSGWCIMLAFMSVMDIERLSFSATALREGMLRTLAGKVSGDSLVTQPRIVAFKK